MRLFLFSSAQIEPRIAPHVEPVGPIVSPRGVITSFDSFPQGNLRAPTSQAQRVSDIG
jgi:hypothetical protein